MDNIIKIEIPEYITHIKLSNSRKAKYYKMTDKIPKKHKNLHIDNMGFYRDSLNRKVIKNSNTVGTPNIKAINGQDFYSGFLNPMIRAKIVSIMKSFFIDALKEIPPLKSSDFPIAFELELHTTKNMLFDIDNKWIYTKVILDSLRFLNIIPEDNVNFVNKAGGISFKEIENQDDRKIIIKITKNNVI